ncbi:uncharacterized protein N7498_001688 [Penicillium cinerascens]|uniref:Uncharacterized protein n=1 Tax=Penicillium cinerascens TaxID=70096 RepID=A0A9W9N8T6_9EURO|nr:uncharacterized protein N7498_001688 [Penicillium cinerascens]KAJ5215281.1 hypothetical protein N7498_001688 [Penicillium cinerascens]
MSVDGSVPSQRHEWGWKGAKHSFLRTVISERARGRSGGVRPQGDRIDEELKAWEGDVVERRTSRII